MPEPDSEGGGRGIIGGRAGEGGRQHTTTIGSKGKEDRERGWKGTSEERVELV